MAKLSKEQSLSLAKWIRQHHPLSAAREAAGADVTEVEEELGFAVHGDECVEWGSTISPQGYGRVTVTIRVGEYRSLQVHRAMREILEGESNLLALHKCSNKRCLNFDHTYFGTSVDNGRDLIELGETSQIGETHTQAKLTRAQVDDLLSRYVVGDRWNPGNSEELAQEFGITRHYVNQIGRGRTWVS